MTNIHLQTKTISPVIIIPTNFLPVWLMTAKCEGSGVTSPYLIADDNYDICDFYNTDKENTKLISYDSPYSNAWQRAAAVKDILNIVHAWRELPWWAWIRRRKILNKLRK